MQFQTLPNVQSPKAAINSYFSQMIILHLNYILFKYLRGNVKDFEAKPYWNILLRNLKVESVGLVQAVSKHSRKIPGHQMPFCIG